MTTNRCRHEWDNGPTTKTCRLCGAKRCRHEWRHAKPDPDGWATQACRLCGEVLWYDTRCPIFTLPATTPKETTRSVPPQPHPGRQAALTPPNPGPADNPSRARTALAAPTVQSVPHPTDTTDRAAPSHT